MNSSSKKPSYTRKNVFIGIDVHKRTYSIVSLVEGIVVKKWQTAAVPEQLARQFKSYFPEANLYSAYEPGFSGFVLHRVLERAGIDNLVVNAASIETTVHNRVKTDKRFFPAFDTAGELFLHTRNPDFAVSWVTKLKYLASDCNEFVRLSRC